MGAGETPLPRGSARVSEPGARPLHRAEWPRRVWHGACLGSRPQGPGGLGVRNSSLRARAVDWCSTRERGSAAMEIPERLCQTRSHRIAIAIAAPILAILLLTPIAASAQAPYAIDGTVPDANCCAEFADPAGSVSELGPVNSTSTKLASIGSATTPMLGFTNPHSATD